MFIKLILSITESQESMKITIIEVGFILLFIICGLFPLSSLAYLGCQAFNNYVIEYRLQKEGLITDATVIERLPYGEQAPNAGRYTLIYSYQAKNSNNELTTYEGMRSVGYKLYYIGQLDSTLKIIYAKDNPEVSHIVGNESGPRLFIFYFLFVLFLIGLFSAGVWEQYKAKKELNQ